MVYQGRPGANAVKKTAAGFLVLALIILLGGSIFALEYPGEKIVYAISPLGKAEYNDLGLVDFQGKKLKLVTFRTTVPGFKDLEKVYADPKTGLPVRVERSISWPLSKEYITEEYSSKNNTLIIKKLIGNKLVKAYSFKGEGPMHNAILLPFYLRTINNLAVGWTFDVRFPVKFKVTLVSVEEVVVPAGKFTAYHFTSIPPKFEIWISKDKYRLPIVIKGTDGLGYSMRMRSHESGRGKVAPKSR